jgi:hypothetical protein
MRPLFKTKSILLPQSQDAEDCSFDDSVLLVGDGKGGAKKELMRFSNLTQTPVQNHD